MLKQPRVSQIKVKQQIEEMEFAINKVLKTIEGIRDEKDSISKSIQKMTDNRPIIMEDDKDKKLR